LIRKKSIEVAIEKFLYKFPNHWEPDILYKNSLKDLKEYIDKLNKNLEKLDITKHTIQNVSYEFYGANNIKKLLNFNNY
jgi:Leucine-rich repeat (LRR) protein